MPPWWAVIMFVGLCILLALSLEYAARQEEKVKKLEQGRHTSAQKASTRAEDAP